jgi:ABC-type antimicrobial peptide transport system ATPase subunit
VNVAGIVLPAYTVSWYVPDASFNGLKIPLSVHAANNNGVAAVSVSSSLDFLVSILPRALLVKEGAAERARPAKLYAIPVHSIHRRLSNVPRSNPR